MLESRHDRAIRSPTFDGLPNGDEASEGRISVRVGRWMRSALAERLLSSLMEWDSPRFTQEIPRVQMLASLKYDEYGKYGAGVKFVENFSRWLGQFSAGQERETAYNFVMNHLIFVSEAELGHLIEVAWPDILKPRLVARAAQKLGLPAYLVRPGSSSDEFRVLSRSTLFLGLSDGARLDQLRRASPLSHEQFVQNYEIKLELASGLKKALVKALGSDEDGTKFQQIFLVDDFSGSGETLIRDRDGEVAGKLRKFQTDFQSLIEDGILDENCEVGLLLYVATDQAKEYLETSTLFSFPRFTVDIVQPIQSCFRVDITDPEMVELCKRYYDDRATDEHKKATPIGYSDCALPLVITHNTPNNSVCLLWSEIEKVDDSPRALFPRYERHHRDRP